MANNQVVRDMLKGSEVSYTGGDTVIAGEGMSLGDLSPQGCQGTTALQHAHQLSKLRVSYSGAAGSAGGKLTASTPVTPATPIALTPSFFALTGRACNQDDCLHQGE